VHKKKKSLKTKPEPLPGLSADEKALLDALLSDTEKPDPSRVQERIPDPRIALALIENLPIESTRVPELLRAFNTAFRQKEVQKAVRKAVFKLKQKGVVVPELDEESKAPIILRRHEQEEPKAYVGPVDGVGSRAVLITIPQIPQGHDLGMGVLNDEHGILEFTFGRYSRKNAKEVQKIFFEKVPFMVETSLSHAAALLERTYGLGTAAGESSGDYVRLRPWLLDHASPLEKPIAYEHFASDPASMPTLTESQVQRLLNHDRMATWTVAPEELRPVIEEINQAEQSRILISEIHRVERIHQIKQASIGKLYPEAKRAIIKKRLEEMAYVFLKSEEEPYARIALACAVSLDEKDSILKVNPFLSALLEKSLMLYFRGNRTQESARLPDQSPSRIILR
jgi:hypothetical protein